MMRQPHHAATFADLRQRICYLFKTLTHGIHVRASSALTVSFVSHLGQWRLIRGIDLQDIFGARHYGAILMPHILSGKVHRLALCEG